MCLVATGLGSAGSYGHSLTRREVEVGGITMLGKEMKGDVPGITDCEPVSQNKPRGTRSPLLPGIK